MPAELQQKIRRTGLGTCGGRSFAGRRAREGQPGLPVYGPPMQPRICVVSTASSLSSLESLLATIKTY
ncbi:hypothetical protein VTN96DRAFT_9239 [Rasamsonia emersonii]